MNRNTSLFFVVVRTGHIFQQICLYVYFVVEIMFYYSYSTTPSISRFMFSSLELSMFAKCYANDECAYSMCRRIFSYQAQNYERLITVVCRCGEIYLCDIAIFFNPQVFQRNLWLEVRFVLFWLLFQQKWKWKFVVKKSLRNWFKIYSKMARTTLDKPTKVLSFFNEIMERFLSEFE